MKKGNAELKTLKTIRLKKNLTINDMALKLDMSKSMYDYIEKGNRRLSYEDAIKIANVLELNPDDIFYEDYKEFFG